MPSNLFTNSFLTKNRNSAAEEEVEAEAAAEVVALEVVLVALVAAAAVEIRQRFAPQFTSLSCLLNLIPQVAVPKTAVGVVIGKGGDMIKKIQSETGARVQFHQGREDGPGDRRCILSGTPGQVAEAKQRIEELIDSVSVSVFLDNPSLFQFEKTNF